MAWTTTQLLSAVRRIASLPTSSTMAGYTDADLLAQADAQLQGKMIPLVAQSRDEHGVHFVTLQTSAEYVRLPPRVAAGRMRDVTVLTSAGAPAYKSVPRLEPEDVADWTSTNTVSSQSMAMVVQAGWLQLVPAPTSTITLRISYVRTASTLAAVSTCEAVTGITPGASVAFAHSAVTLTGAKDIILASNGDSLGDSLTGTYSLGSSSFVATTLAGTFSNTAAETARYVSEGVYLCPQGTTCIVPLPDLMSPLLAYRTAVAVMYSIGDTEAAQRTEAVADSMESNLVPLISERIEGEPQRVRPQFQRRARGFLRTY